MANSSGKSPAEHRHTGLAFLEELKLFHQSRGSCFRKLLTVVGRDLDRHALCTRVISLGVFAKKCLLRNSNGGRNAINYTHTNLDLEHNQKVLNMEHAQQMKLKERQKFFEEAFQEDMEQYLSTGYLQIAKGRDPIGSMSSMEVNVDMLEQMDLMDMSDQEALDVFLNSGEDKAVLSPCLGPDMENFENEITIQVPSQLELRQKLSSMSSNQTDLASQEANEEGGSPIIQSDEDEVHVDTALAVIGTNENANSDISDESDSQTV